MGRVGVIPWNMQWLSYVLIGCIFYGMVYTHDSFALLAVQDFFFCWGESKSSARNFFQRRIFSVGCCARFFFYFLLYNIFF